MQDQKKYVMHNDNLQKSFHKFLRRYNNSRLILKALERIRNETINSPPASFKAISNIYSRDNVGSWLFNDVFYFIEFVRIICLSVGMLLICLG